MMPNEHGLFGAFFQLKAAMDVDSQGWEWVCTCTSWWRHINNRQSSLSNELNADGPKRWQFIDIIDEVEMLSSNQFIILKYVAIG